MIPDDKASQLLSIVKQLGDASKLLCDEMQAQEDRLHRMEEAVLELAVEVGRRLGALEAKQ